MISVRPARALRPSVGLAVLLLGIGCLPQPGLAQSQSRFDWGIEAKGHYRDSNFIRLPVPFPPEGERFAMETVETGEHYEVSAVTLFLDARFSPRFQGHLKVDFIDLHERNPTTTDKEIDIDEAWLRFGEEALPATLPEGSGGYLKFGKMGKFERQDDRHLESYGLVSTAFNRLEDIGVELGIDLGRHFYLKFSATQGNPLFMRDPNALAGDNGLDDRDASEGLGTGIVILYDAEVEDPDSSFFEEMEIGWGVGFRFADASNTDGIDFLVWGYERDLASTVELEGTFYGGDLDLLEGPFGTDFSYELAGTSKEEIGANLWVYQGGLTFFGQYVDQDVAGLKRTGLEAELAWSIDLPVGAALGGKQLFPFVQPAIRYSKLDPEFAAPPITPSPSFSWDWEKTDYGIRLGIVDGIDLTAEFADNRFVLKSGATVHNDELLATLRWRM